MRLAALLVLSVVPIVSLTAPRPVSAQLTGVYYDGMLQHPLGAATLDVTATPTGRRLEFHNLGSSGEDGVAIDLGRGARGRTFSWTAPPDEGPDGSSYTCAMFNGNVVIGSLSCTTNADGTEDLSADFSGVGATGGWIVLLRSDGTVAARRQHVPLDLHKPVSRTVGGLKRSTELIEWRAYTDDYRWVEVRYDGNVLVDGVTCRAVRFICDTGAPVSVMSSVRLTCAVPTGSPPGSIECREQGLLPPFAGNGPDDAGVMVALGDMHYAVGSTGTGSDPIALENLGSSGQDGVSYSGGCCSSELGLEISDATQSSSAPGVVQFDCAGTAGSIGDQPIGHLTCAFQGTDWSYMPDFSALGATGYRAMLYRDGVLVASNDNPSQGVRKWGDGHVTLMKAYDDGEVEYRIICITHPCPGSNVLMGGAQYLADEIRFQPIAAPGTPLPPVSSVSSMSALATGCTVITISGAQFRSSAPTVGVSGPAPVTELAMARLAPNPARGPVDLMFALPQAGHAVVSVIDVTGRQVRSLARGMFAAGAHDLSWDGRDDSGSAAPAGIYFLRVQSGAGTRVARFARLQ